ncbi:MAG TPA: bifunctional adenosylcobinamide kinase/adenosylcobinamide-phosphate guanylyltransferase [Candidatus Butyricicoccus stercorigallinarum]|nr:bifunctional adenosylcobinamide kinase/adenosylcobinamide-phosphate guanylyltransferase [Candidatus Butyricicoccus stercorigallinarum]
MLILVTGGAASGKSARAEDIVCRLAGDGKKLYVAAMEPSGAEAQRRIARHRALRAGKGFDTLEHAKNFDRMRVPSGYAAALLECLGTALANEMFSPGGAGAHAADSILSGVAALTAACPHVVVVTNEIFSDGRTYDAGTMAYLRALGALNQQLARRADAVIESVCGIPVTRKGSTEFA